jgi:hypothetical protein
MSRGDELMRQREELEKKSVKFAPKKKKFEVFNTKTGGSVFVSGVDAREYCKWPEWSMEKPEPKKTRRQPANKKAPSKK